MATITGTSLDDVLLTTVDVDTVSASSGNDIILVGPGFHDAGETISAGGGVDRIFFTAGTDGDTLTLLASVTGVEAVLMAGVQGRLAGTGDLIIDASAVLAGLTLVGNDGDNVITGTAKNDLIIGNGGVDDLRGGAGNDSLVIRVDAGEIDDADGGAQSEGNTLVLNGTAAGTMVIDFSVAAGDDQLIEIDAVAENQTQADFSHLDASHARGGGVEVTGSALANTIIGTGLADTITGGAGTDVLVGGNENDLFLIASGTHHASSEVMSGGKGDEDVLRFTNNDSLVGATLTLSSKVTGIETVEIADAAGVTTGTTVLHVNAASVKEGLSIVGNDGANKLTGTSKDDIITGNEGADTIAGGGGNDRFVVEDDLESTIDDRISDSGGTGDFIVFTSIEDNDTLFIGAKVTGVDGVYLSDNATDDTLLLAGTTMLNVDASAASVGLLFKGNAGANVLTGGVGKDTFEGGAGIDTITGGASADSVLLDAGELDRADAGLAKEGNTLRLTGAAAALLDVDLSIADGVDQMDDDAELQTGFTHVDASDLDAEGVRVTASSRMNKITGSAQNDVFVVARQLDLVTSAGVSDVIDGGGQVADTDGDILRFTSGPVSSTLRTLKLTSSVKGVERVQISDADGDTDTGTHPLHVNAAKVGNKLYLEGNGGANTLTGTKFEDTLNGNAGADVLKGGLGNDVYEIDSAADLVSGDTISDTDTTLGNQDIVRFTSTVDGEVAVLFNNRISGVEKFEVGEDAGNVGISGAAITGFAAYYLGNDGDNTLAGGSKNDTLEGGLGNDSITGGGGADRIVVNMDDGGHGDINAGALSEKNWLAFKVKDDEEVFGVFVDLTGADQILTSDGTQTGFRNVDASGLTHADDPEVSELVIAIFGGDEANHFIGSFGEDNFTPGLGNDTIEGGGGSDNWFISTQAELDGDIYTDGGSTRDDYIVFTSAADGDTLRLRNNVFGVDGADCGGVANINLDARDVDQPFAVQGNSGNNHLRSTRHGESLFDTGGIDTMDGGLGDDDYTMLDDFAWVFVEDSSSSNDDKIVDAGGIDHFYYAGGGTNTLLVGNRGTNAIEIFAVTGDDIKPTGVFRRDIETTNGAGLDVRHVDHAITLGGNWGDNYLRATDHNDTIIGHKGQDTIVAGAGTDHITMDVSDGTVYQIDAGAENENNLLFIQGEAEETIRFDLSQTTDQITHIGAVADAQTQSGLRHIDAAAMAGDSGIIVLAAASNAVNKLTGSNQDDVLEGGGGNDVVLGGAGNDAIVVRDPAHMVSGEKADGGDGEDAIWFAWAGSAKTFKPSPTAFLSIEVLVAADDTGATTGTDAINLNASLFTRAMKLIGNDGDNDLTGTSKDDTLTGNGGADSLSGSGGNDVFIYEAPADGTGDTIAGSSGTDTVKFLSDVDAEVLVLGASVSGIEIAEVAKGAAGGDKTIGIDASAAGASVDLEMRGNEVNNTLYGGAGDDTIFGDLGNDSLRGGLGADSFQMGIEDGDRDDIDAGATAEDNSLVVKGVANGDMVWDLSSVTDQLVSIDAVDDGNVIIGITNLDLSQVTEGAATITGTADVNRLVGTGKDDTFIVLEVAHFGASEVITGGAGTDTLVLNATVDGVWTLTTKVTGIESVLLDPAAPGVDIHAGAVKNALMIEANDGDNVITGTTKNDTIIGHAGFDDITAGTGADEVKTDVAVEDAIHAGANSEGNQWFLEGAATDTMVFDLSLTGDQLTIGGAAGLVQRGFMHVNASGVSGFGVQITGSSAANKIVGSQEQDTITGGLGADTIGMDVTGSVYDEIDAGALTEGNELRLFGIADATQFVDLSDAVDQVTGAGTQVGFLHFDASAMTAFGVEVTGSSGANRIAGTALQDTINAGLGADIVTMDIGSGNYDAINAGGGSEGDTLVLVGATTGILTIDLGVSNGADQFTLVGAGAEAQVQSGFQHLDAAAVLDFGVVLRGTGTNNTLTGTVKADTFVGRAGSDKIDLGIDPGQADTVVYETRMDGVTAKAASVSRDQILHFKPGEDNVRFSADFNGGAYDLDDIDNNDAFAFAIDERANFTLEDEALFISSAKSKLGDSLLFGNSLADVTLRINAVGVTAVAGDDGLIVVQGKKTAGVYYYQELGTSGVQTSELTLLGTIDSLAQQGDFELG